MIEDFGFVKVLEVPFHGDPEIENDDVFYVFFMEKYGILLELDTYNGSSVSGGSFYYQWEPKNIDESYLYVSNGGFEKVGDHLIWCGSHDCRENIISNILGLAENGKFMTPWISPRHFTSPKFVHWGDHHTHYSEPWDVGFKMYEKSLVTVGPERFNMLPEYVKNAIAIVYNNKGQIEP